MGATSTRSSSCSRAMASACGQRPHSELFAVCGDQQHLSGADAVVDPCFVGGCDAGITSHRSAPACTLADGGHFDEKRPPRDLGRPKRGRPGLGGSAPIGTRADLGTRTPAGWGHRWPMRRWRGRALGVPLPNLIVVRGYQGEQPLDTLRRGAGPARRRRIAAPPAAGGPTAADRPAVPATSRVARGHRSGADARDARPARRDPGRGDRRRSSRSSSRRSRSCTSASRPSGRSRLGAGRRSPIDAMAALVDALGDRLGPNAEPLRQAVAAAAARVRRGERRARRAATPPTP